ncbi:MAG TPA: hypothetical protein IGR64_02345 [Leptolyngbyaceae cyanobacterium M65_K2018_010]|nr:hypothetical protein [Leptolyngbyaceae cyanobacterium M65_K2018_010]
MKTLFSLPRSVPIVAIGCALIFLAYGLGGGPGLAVVCDGPQGDPVDTIPEQFPHCRVSQWRRLGGLPALTRDFYLEDVEIVSHLCDNTPRGGVRFCHRLTLLGDPGSVTLAEIRTPLTAQSLVDGLQNFIAGEGSDRLAWTTPRPWRGHLTTAIIGLLLAITAWGWWEVRWPAEPPSPLAVDGEAELDPPSKRS